MTTGGHVTIYRQQKLSSQKAQIDRYKNSFCDLCAFLWLVLIDFFDEAAAHEARGDERGSVVMHLFQQLLATIVDEANTCQIN